MSRSERFDLLVKVVATVVALFGVWKFFADRDALAIAETRTRSLSYMERFAGEDMIQARASLTQFWRSHPEFAAYVREEKLTEREYSNFVAVAYSNYAERPALDAALFRLLVFFDELEYCRHAELCDKVILHSYFCKFAVRQAKVYGPFYTRMSAEIGAQDMDGELRNLAAACNQGPEPG